MRSISMLEFEEIAHSEGLDKIEAIELEITERKRILIGAFKYGKYDSLKSICLSKNPGRELISYFDNTKSTYGTLDDMIYIVDDMPRRFICENVIAAKDYEIRAMIGTLKPGRYLVLLTDNMSETSTKPVDTDKNAAPMRKVLISQDGIYHLYSDGIVGLQVMATESESVRPDRFSILVRLKDGTHGIGIGRFTTGEKAALAAAEIDWKLMDADTKIVMVPCDKDAPVQEGPDTDKLSRICEILTEYSQIDGAHHKAWCLDQIARIVYDQDYEKFVYEYEHTSPDGQSILEDKVYGWDPGIAP